MSPYTAAYILVAILIVKILVDNDSWLIDYSACSNMIVKRYKQQPPTIALLYEIIVDDGANKSILLLNYALFELICSYCFNSFRR
jgi:hypothetical protein